MAHSQPACARALQALEHLIADARARHQVRLAPVKVLAASAGVSVTTMLKALRVLQRDGVLDIRQKRGITIAPDTHAAQSPQPPPGRRTRLQERIAARIEHDILEGRLAAGAPMRADKATVRRYETGYATFRAALERLLERGLVQISGASYRVSSIRTTIANGALVLALPCDTKGDPVFWPPFSSDLFEGIRDECARSSVKLVTLPYRYAEDRFHPLERHAHVRDLLISHAVLGAIFMTGGFKRETIEATAARFFAQRLPVVLIDTIGDYRLPHAQTRRQRYFRFCATDTSSCGSAVARFLLRTGHRALCYLSPYHDQPWSVHRLEGVRRVADTARGVSVHEAVAGKADVLGRPSAYEWVRQMLLANPWFETNAELRAYLSPPALSRLASQFRNEIGLACERTALIERSEALFEQALASGATAWICANDHVAAGALSFLSRRGRAVPRDISVIGFDDTPSACMHGISSYSFNQAGIAALAVRAVLAPRDIERAYESCEHIDVTGRIIERMTTAPGPASRGN